MAHPTVAEQIDALDHLIARYHELVAYAHKRRCAPDVIADLERRIRCFEAASVTLRRELAATREPAPPKGAAA